MTIKPFHHCKIEILSDSESFNEAIRWFSYAVNFATNDPAFDHPQECCLTCGSDFPIRLEGKWENLPHLYRWMGKRITTYPNARKFSVILDLTPQSELYIKYIYSVKMVVWFAGSSGEITHATYWSLCRSGKNFFICGPQDWQETVQSGKTPEYPEPVSEIDTNIQEEEEAVKKIGILLAEHRATTKALEEFHSAMEFGDSQRIKTILEKTKNIDNLLWREHLSNRLLDAIRDGQTEIAKLLLERGIDADTQNPDYTVLMKAAYFGRREIVRLLLEKRASINTKNRAGKTALMLASKQGYAEIVAMLIDKGAEVNERDNEGCTALIEAAWDGHPEVVKLLLAHGADVHIQENKSGTTALWRAADNDYSTEEKLKEIIRMLIEQGAKVTIRSKEGKTPLMRADRNNRSGIVELLKRSGARE